jgi:hypothetical protein
MANSDDLKQRNRRLGLILASVAAAFMVGFIVRLSFFGH